MQLAWIWFGLMALALIGEVMTGTFYLLIVAAGFAVAGGLAYVGMSVAVQIAVCAIAVLVATLLLRKTGVLKKREVDASANADVNMDVGQTVTIDVWTTPHSTRVWYRGTHWEAELAPGAPAIAAPRRYVITHTRGNTLVVSPAA